jgi:hypothetical protein
VKLAGVEEQNIAGQEADCDTETRQHQRAAFEIPDRNQAG